jgi:hypothetical protein
MRRSSAISLFAAIAFFALLETGAFAQQGEVQVFENQGIAAEESIQCLWF